MTPLDAAPAGLAVAGAWLLAGVLAWAAIAKVRRPGPTAEGFRALGLPAATVLGWAVPVAELVTAALLVAVPAAGAVAAVVLLGAFTAFLARRLRGGASVACGCFGTARKDPLTWAALLRNGLLIGLALPALWLAGPQRPPLEGVLVVSTAAAIGAVAVALADLRARTGRLWDNRLPAGPGGGL